MNRNSTKDAAAPTGSNPRGIPNAPFVERVEDYVSTRDDVEGTLKSFQEMISKYQFMEANNQRRVAGLKDKIPDIQKTLDTVRFLKSRKVIYQLHDLVAAITNSTSRLMRNRWRLHSSSTTPSTPKLTSTKRKKSIYGLV